MQTSHISNLNNDLQREENIPDDDDDDDQTDLIKNIDKIVKVKDNLIVNNKNNNNVVQVNNVLNVNNDITNENDDENASLLVNSINNDETVNRNNENKVKTRCLYFLDMLLSVVFFSPMSSFYWYGTWLYLDTFFIKDDYKLSNFVSWGIGLLLLFPGYLFQQDFQRFYEYLKRYNYLGTIVRFLMRTIYIYLMCFAVVAQWRGLWNLLAIYFFQDWISQLSLAIVATAYFVLSRSTKSLNTSPFLLSMDDNENYFSSKSRVELAVSSPYFQFVIDYTITEIVECFALVVIWRGFENLSDYFIFPNDQFKCVITCLIASHSIYLIVAITQNFLFKKTSKMSLVYRLFVGDLVHIVMFYSSVLAWKFYWNAIDFYIVTNTNQLYVYIAFHLAPFLVAILTRTSFILVGPGTSFMDGEISPEITAYFELNYLSSIFNNDNSITENINDTTEEQQLLA